jgi:hypothetical protein
MKTRNDRQAALLLLSQHLNRLSIRLSQQEDNSNLTDCFSTESSQETDIAGAAPEDASLFEAFEEMKRLDNELEDLEKRATSLSIARSQQRAILSYRVRESEVRNEQRRRIAQTSLSERTNDISDINGTDDNQSLSSSNFLNQNNKQFITSRSIMSGTSFVTARHSVSASSAGALSASRRFEPSGNQIFTSRPTLRKDFSKSMIGSSTISSVASAPAGQGASAVRKLIESRKVASSIEEEVEESRSKFNQINNPQDFSLRREIDAGKAAAVTVKRWNEDIGQSLGNNPRTLSIEEESKIESMFKDDLDSKKSFRFKDF